MAFFKKFQKELKTKNELKVADIDVLKKQEDDIIKDTDERMRQMLKWLGMKRPKLHHIITRAQAIRTAAWVELPYDINEYRKNVYKMMKEHDKLVHDEMELFKTCQKLFSKQLSHMSMWMEQGGRLEDRYVARSWDAAQGSAEWMREFVKGEHSDQDNYKWVRLARLNYHFKKALDMAGHHIDRSAVENYLGTPIATPR